MLTLGPVHLSDLQIHVRMGNGENLEIFFLVSQYKHTLYPSLEPLAETVLMRVTAYGLWSYMKNYPYIILVTSSYLLWYSDLPSFEQFLVPNSRVFDKIS